MLPGCHPGALVGRFGEGEFFLSVGRLTTLDSLRFVHLSHPRRMVRNGRMESFSSRVVRRVDA